MQTSLLEKAKALDTIYQGRVGEKERQAEAECNERWNEYRNLYDSFVARYADVLEAIAIIGNTVEGREKIKRLYVENEYTRCNVQVVDEAEGTPGPRFNLWASQRSQFHGRPVWEPFGKIPFDQYVGVNSFYVAEPVDAITGMDNPNKYNKEYVEGRIKMLKVFQSFDRIEEQFTEMLNRELEENKPETEVNPLMNAAKGIY